MPLTEHRPQDIGAIHLPMRGLVKWSHLRPILKGILGKMGIKVSTDGKSIQSIEGGLHIGVGTGDGGSTPFLVTVTGGTSVSINPGTIMRNDDTKSGGVLLTHDPAPTITISGTGTGYIWIKLTVDHYLDAAGTFVVVSYYNKSEIGSGSSLPSDDPEGGIYYIKLATIVDGVKTNQWVTYNISCAFKDEGRARSRALLTLIAAP